MKKNIVVYGEINLKKFCLTYSFIMPTLVISSISEFQCESFSSFPFYPVFYNLKYPKENHLCSFKSKI